MKSTVYNDVEAFSQDTHALLCATIAQEMENNLAVGLIRRIREKLYDDPYMISVMDDVGRMVLAAVMTAPYNLVLTRGNKRALPVLIEDVIENRPEIPGVIGPDDMVGAFAKEWYRATGRESKAGLNMTFYALTAVTMPEKDVPGSFRKATERDADWMTDWLVCFAIDSHLPEHEQIRDPDRTCKRIQNEELYVWEKGNQPVSISGYSPLTDHGVRIGSVYTPPEERGKGYASACVAYLSRHLLENGTKWCSLFADNANPISNSIYKKIGYKEHCTYQEYRFKS